MYVSVCFATLTCFCKASSKATSSFSTILWHRSCSLWIFWQSYSLALIKTLLKQIHASYEVLLMLSSLPWHELKHAQHMPNYSNSKFQKILGTSEFIYLFDILSLAVWSFDGNAESAPRSYQKIAYSEKISFLKRLFQNQFRSPCQWQCATLRTSFGFSGSTSFIVLSVLSSFSSSSKPSFTCKKCTLGQQTAGWQRGNRLQCLQTFLTGD